jgi:hypothetical protein
MEIQFLVYSHDFVGVTPSARSQNLSRPFLGLLQIKPQIWQHKLFETIISFRYTNDLESQAQRTQIQALASDRERYILRIDQERTWQISNRQITRKNRINVFNYSHFFVLSDVTSGSHSCHRNNIREIEFPSSPVPGTRTQYL